MSHLLNKPAFRTAVYAAQQGGYCFSVLDKHFCLDANNLALWELDEPDETVELCPVRPQFPLFVPPSAMMLVLEVTNACPLRCTYCFNEAYDNRSGRMTFETARRAIVDLIDKRAFAQSGGRRPHVGFFGGEPMANWELVEQIVPFAQGYFAPGSVGFSMTTNAVLIKPKHASFMKEKGFSFIVSVDGPKHLHDKYRIYGNGKGSFDDTMRGLKLLADAGVRSITLRSTFSPGEESLLERVQFLNELCDQGLGSWVSVEPVCLTETHCIKHDYGTMSGYTEETAAAAEKDYIETALWAAERYKAGLPMRYHNFVKPVERLL